MNVNNIATSIVAVVFMAMVSACEPLKPPSLPYVVSFKHQMPKTSSKLDVTLGVVAPTFSGDGRTWWQSAKAEETSRAFVAALKGSSYEMLTAKGFNTTGPFDSVDAMTYPEKKNADLVLVPDLNAPITIKFVPGSSTGEGLSQECKVAVNGSGNVSLQVWEPLSEQKMWVKSFDVSIPESQAAASGLNCMMLKPGAVDEWKAAHVAMYNQIMDALDKYVNGEEFQDLKKQAKELREKKRY